MFKLEKFAVVAALVFFAFNGMASNFRAADQVYIPAAGKIAGSSGTFISDVFIANVTTDTVTVSVIYSAGSGGTRQYFNDLFDLAPGERKEYVDFFVSALGLPSGFGQLIFNACKKNEDCVNTQDADGVSPHFRNIAVQSRIYSIPPNTTLSQNPPTTGQLFSGVPWYNFVSSDMAANGLDKVFITGLRNTGSGPGTYRGNIGIVNASQFSSTDIVVTLKSGNGAQLGQISKRLSPLGHLQFSLGAEFPSFTGAGATNAFLEVEQRNSTPTSDAPVSCLPNGCPAFFAYGSILDNVSGDATTLEPMYLKALSDEAIRVIYPFTGTSGRITIRRAVGRR
ncbi:MAG: hypothetical protein ACXW28_01555 [Thermoanaerobaculia bacterium]